MIGHNQHNFLSDRLVIAAYRLPYKFVKYRNGFKAVQNSGGLVSAILSLSKDMQCRNEGQNTEKILWAGTGEFIPETIKGDELADSNFQLLPVQIPPEVDTLYYGGFCNDLIWPLFHYFPTKTVLNEKYYKAFVEANQIFCDTLIKEIKPGDFIWIHDYQLFLLPAMIRKLMPEVTIGFFLHIPFPSFEIFRLIPRYWRSELLKGMLGADLVGFHTNDYTQHFIKSVKRTLGYEFKNNTIYAEDRIIRADAFPIGIDYAKFNNATNSFKVEEEKKKLREHVTSKKLIFSVDRLDYSKGFINRLNGYEHFLEKYPQWHEKVIFNMVVVPSRDSIDQYKYMKKEIDAAVGRINSKYSSIAWRPIIYQYKSLGFDELVALYDLSDVGLITPLRDGMNLVAKEYVACQVENKGVLILSEMAGAASELNDAIIINPTDVEEMADAINIALEMPVSEKEARLLKMKKRLQIYNVFTWANDIMHQVEHVKKDQDMMSVKFINEEILQCIRNDYNKSDNRLIFIDYDGTLVPFSKYPEAAKIDIQTLNMIGVLAENPANTVVIISGRDRQFLDDQLGRLKVTIIAEHGYFIRESDGTWKHDQDIDLKWKEKVRPILTEYAERCNGAFIEEKHASLAWHYRNAENDFANLRLIELKEELSDILSNHSDLSILEGHKVLEVKSTGYDKGTAAKRLLNTNIDFIMAIGDDKTDEDLFRSLPDRTYTIKVGSEPSRAKYNLRRQEDIKMLFKNLK